MGTKTAEIRKAAVRLGYEVRNGKSHYKIRRDSGPLVIVPRAENDGVRQIANALAHLRRSGYEDLAEAVSPRPARSKSSASGAVHRRAANRSESTAVPTVVLEEGVSVSLEWIDAGRATELLAGNVNNRPVRSEYVAALARQFAANEVCDAVGSVSVAKTGRLLDGQHRLLALLVASETQPALRWRAVVVRGLDESVMPIIDIGRPRRLGDVLRIERGERYHSQLAAALNALHRLQHNQFSSGGGARRWYPSTFEAVALLDREPAVRDWVKSLTVSRRRAAALGSPAVLAALAHMCEQTEVGRGVAYVAALDASVPVRGEPQALRVLREHLQWAREGRLRVSSADVARWSVIALNAWVEGRRLRPEHLRTSLVGRVPHLIGYPYAEQIADLAVERAIERYTTT